MTEVLLIIVAYGLLVATLAALAYAEKLASETEKLQRLMPKDGKS